MIKPDDMVYICSPLSAPTKEELRANMEQARRYMQFVSRSFQCRAITPHAYLPELLDDTVSWERELGIAFGMKLLENSQVLLVCGERISKDMEAEIIRARELGIPVYTFLSDGQSAGMIQGNYACEEAKV